MWVLPALSGPDLGLDGAKRKELETELNWICPCPWGVALGPALYHPAWSTGQTVQPDPWAECHTPCSPWVYIAPP